MRRTSRWVEIKIIIIKIIMIEKVPAPSLVKPAINGQPNGERWRASRKIIGGSAPINAQFTQD